LPVAAWTLALISRVIAIICRATSFFGFSSDWKFSEVSVSRA